MCPERKEALQKKQALPYGKPIFCAIRILSCCFSWVNSNREAPQNAPWVLRETNLRPFNTDMIVLKVKSPVPQERLAVWQNSRSAPWLSPKDHQYLSSHPCLLPSCSKFLVSSLKTTGKAGGGRETEAGRHNIFLREQLEYGKLAAWAVTGRIWGVFTESSVKGLRSQSTHVTSRGRVLSPV